MVSLRGTSGEARDRRKVWSRLIHAPAPASSLLMVTSAGFQPLCSHSCITRGRNEALLGGKTKICAEKYFRLLKTCRKPQNSSTEKKKGVEQGSDNVQRLAECKGIVVQNQDSEVCEQQT